MPTLLSPLLASAESTSENFASFDVPLWAWVALISAITAMLVIDLLLVHKTAHVITIKEAASESAIWISSGLAFGLVMIGWHGGQAGAEYYAGFLIEKSLSVDNVFVWAVIFSFFAARFFPDPALVIMGLYIGGIVVAVLPSSSASRVA